MGCEALGSHEGEKKSHFCQVDFFSSASMCCVSFLRARLCDEYVVRALVLRMLASACFFSLNQTAGRWQSLVSETTPQTPLDSKVARTLPLM